MLIGIDLGTTNSAVALWKEGTPMLVPNALGELLTPSAISIDKEGKTWVGTPALDRRAAHPQETISSFKRLMGTKRRVSINGKEYGAEDFSAIILESLIRDVEAFSDKRPTEAVITVPAYFNDRQRKATRRAGELAGLYVRRLINEPTAAALAFGLQNKGDREPFLVFDLGGGTFDVSIVEMFDGIVEVRASAGDNRLGGDDFNEVLTQLVVPRLDPQGLLEALTDEHREALLIRAAETCRKALTNSNQAEFTVTFAETQLSTTVTSAELEAACEPLLHRLRAPVVRALRDSNIEAADLSEIVLVGGATRMPAIRKTLTRLFGRFPNASIHPDHAVALGASIQAGLAGRDVALEEIRITDVCPFTLGIEVAEQDRFGGLQRGLFSPIIERNSPVPVSRIKTYSTMGDDQKHIEFGIYQGEAREVSSNIKLGRIAVPVPPHPAGEVSAEVRFSFDSSGLLEVDVHVPLTGEKHNLIIMDEEDRPDDKSIEERRAALALLKYHPREEAANVALMARAERAYEDHIGDLRQVIGQWITEYVGALDSQNPQRITETREFLIIRLNELDHITPL